MFIQLNLWWSEQVVVAVELLSLLQAITQVAVVVAVGPLKKLNYQRYPAVHTQLQSAQKALVAKINGDFAIQTNNARMDAAKAGAQVYAQLTSSAYSMIHANASVSGTSSSSTTVGYSYSNDTTSAVSPITYA